MVIVAEGEKFRSFLNYLLVNYLNTHFGVTWISLGSVIIQFQFLDAINFLLLMHVTALSSYL